MEEILLDGTKRLLRSAARLRQDLLRGHQTAAPNFNLFSILGVEAKEVTTHSAFLGHLLSPNETHAQGDLFLRTFLTKVVEMTPPPTNDWVVTRELPFVGGRLDIVLRSAAASTLFVVENKIDTQDSQGQLVAYRQWLDAPLRSRTYKTRLLIYLTPDGSKAKNASGIDYTPVAYSAHIVDWLTECLDHVKPHSVRSAIDTYLKTIHNMNAKATMKDDLDEKVLALLNSPANQGNRVVALRIARVAKFIREDILKNFWATGEVYLNKKCVEAGLKHWSVDRYENDSVQEKCGLILTVKNIPDGAPHPVFSFNQYAGNALFRWEWGVKFDGWLGKNDKIRALPEAIKLTAIMDETLEMPRKRGWDGYRLFTDDARGVERTLEEELEKKSEISEFFEGGWKVFQQLEPQLRKLNSAVQRQIG